MFVCAHWGAVGEFAASRHGALTRSQAADLGLSRKVIGRLKGSGHLAEPLPGVLVGSAQQYRAVVDACDIVELDGITCTNIARTLADLGSVDPADKVRVAFESAWRRGVSLT